MPLEEADVRHSVEDGELRFRPSGPGGWPGCLEGCFDGVCICDVDFHEFDEFSEPGGEISTCRQADVQNTDFPRILSALE